MYCVHNVVLSAGWQSIALGQMCKSDMKNMLDQVSSEFERLKYLALTKICQWTIFPLNVQMLWVFSLAICGKCETGMCHKRL
jgi:hypothetical protein